MTPTEFRQDQDLEFNHFTELTSTGIKPNYDNIERFAEEYYQTKLKLLGIANVMARTSDANNATMATRIGELNSLHVAASMDIQKTTESLNHILEYKQEAAKQMLRCSDEEQMEQIAQVIKQADDMICKVLGMYVP